MSFIRKITFEITFDVYSDDRFVPPTIVKTSESEKIYENKKDAYNKGGELESWANNVAEFYAVKVASDHVGSSIPSFRDTSTWKDISTVYGSTYNAQNIDYNVISVSEPKLPQAIIDLYNFIKDRIKKENKKIAIWEIGRDKLRKTKELTTDQIKEIRVFINKIEKSYKIIREDERRIEEIEIQYPEILE